MDDASTRSILKLLSLLAIAAKYKHYGGVVTPPPLRRTPDAHLKPRYGCAVLVYA